MSLAYPRSHSRWAAFVLALLVTAGSTILSASPATAGATVHRLQYTSEWATAFDWTSEGCISAHHSVTAGHTQNGETRMSYFRASQNSCTGEELSVFGSAPTELFDFHARGPVHAIATIPLDDGTEIHLDLVWEAWGPVNMQSSTTTDLVPGDSIYRTSTRGTIQEARVTGTMQLDAASISARRGSTLIVEFQSL